MHVLEPGKPKLSDQPTLTEACSIMPRLIVESVQNHTLVIKSPSHQVQLNHPLLVVVDLTKDSTRLAYASQTDIYLVAGVDIALGVRTQLVHA